MHLCVVICENGLGHFKRCIGLMHHWLKKYPRTELTVICREWQVKATNDWEWTDLLHQKNCTLNFEKTSPGVVWSPAPGFYQEDRLIGWIDRLRDFKPLSTADIVISDNLCGILELRPDTILMGSFLWMEVLNVHKNNPEVARFIQYEKALLANKPPMLCVGTIAMPEVLEYTQAVPLPWFGLSPKSAPKVRRPQKTIALIGGATPAADEVLLSIANALLEKSSYRLTMSAKFFPHITRMDPARLFPFGFQQADYEACDIVICRPGIGTVTECMVSNTPMLLIPETANAEMVHNTARLVELGAARALPPDFSINDLLQSLHFIFEPDNYDRMSLVIEGQEVNGFEEAIQWITLHRHLN